MAANFTPAVRRLGIISAMAVALLSLLYAAMLAVGLLSLPSPGQPISDPIFSLLEALILLIGPFLVAMMAVTHALAGARPATRIALLFTILLVLTTSALHLTILLLGHLPGSAHDWSDAFRWPSLSYAVDILAWDVFFPFAMLFASVVFVGSRLARSIRVLMIASGVLALAGLLGPVSGEMRLRNIGILGYAVVFPVAAALLAFLFHRTAPATE